MAKAKKRKEQKRFEVSFIVEVDVDDYEDAGEFIDDMDMMEIERMVEGKLNATFITYRVKEIKK